MNADVTLINCTIASNAAAGTGGAIRYKLGTLTLKNTIIADNTQGLGGQMDGPVGDTNAHNIFEGGCEGLDPADITSDPNLGSLQDNGGDSYTHKPGSGSVAIDAGLDSDAPATDQRGISRPQGSASDIGAVEVDNETPTTATVTTPSNGSYYNASTIPSPFQGAVADNSGGGGLNANSSTFYIKRASDNHYWNESNWDATAQLLATTHDGTTDGSQVTWSSNVTLPTWSNGTYYVKVKASDKAANSYEGSEITFYYDSDGTFFLDHFDFDTISSPQTAGSAFSITIYAEDSGGNTITAFNQTVDLSDTTGTISPDSVVTFSSGTWTGNVTITGAQTNVTITATYNSTSGTSNSFNISAEEANYFRVTGTGTMTAGGSQTITITAYDQYGNVTTVYDGDKTLTFSGANASPSPATNPTCTNSSSTDIAFGSNTVVSFSDGEGTSTMKLYKAETASIKATQGSITTSDANDLDVTVNPGSGDNLAFSQQPTDTVAGATVTSAVTVQVRDQWNNVRTSDNSTSVGIAINNNPGGGTLSGTTPRTASSGVATFNDLSIDKAGDGYTLDATSSGLTTATSNGFTVTAGALASFEVNVPASGTAGTAFSVTVTAKDSEGNTTSDVSGATAL